MNLTGLPNINLKNKIIFTFILFPLSLGLIAYFVVFPTIKDIKNIKDQIEEQRTDLEVKYRKGQSLKKLKNNLEIIKPQISVLEKIFIKQDDVLKFITTLEETAASNDVKQKPNLSSTNSVKKNDYTKTPLQIFTSGNFIKQLEYLIALESSDYYINVNTIEFSFRTGRASDSSNEDIGSSVNMTIFADTFWKE